MNILLNRLLAIINASNPNSTNFYIAEKFLHYLYDIQNYSIADMAVICDVSKSTISKFVREMGFDDYMDFRLSAIAAIKGVTYNYGMNSIDYIEEEGLAKYLDVLKDDFTELARSIKENEDKIEELVNDIIRYDNIAAFGVVYSQTAAFDLQYRLAFLKKIIYTTTNDVLQEEYIRTAGENQLIIIFSNSGRYITEYQLLEGNPQKDIFNLTKAKIVVVTSNVELEKDPRVDLCITLRYSKNVQNHPYFFRVIIDLIGAKYELKMNHMNDK